MRIFAGHIHHDMGLAITRQFDVAYTANRKARKSQVHADHNAFGIFRNQNQFLCAFKYTSRIHHIQGRRDHEREHKNQQQHRFELKGILRRLRCQIRRRRHKGIWNIAHRTNISSQKISNMLFD